MYTHIYIYIYIYTCTTTSMLNYMYHTFSSVILCSPHSIFDRLLPVRPRPGGGVPGSRSWRRSS